MLHIFLSMHLTHLHQLFSDNHEEGTGVSPFGDEGTEVQQGGNTCAQLEGDRSGTWLDCSASGAPHIPACVLSEPCGKLHK